jgi:hypothetical protein
MKQKLNLIILCIAFLVLAMPQKSFSDRISIAGSYRVGPTVFENELQVFSQLSNLNITYNIVIFDTQGKVVFHKENMTSAVETISTTRFATGNYYYKLMSAGYVLKGKLKKM